MRWVQRAVVVAALWFFAAPASGQVLVNEILVRAATGSHVDQTVELRNGGTSSVNIGGWFICHLGDCTASLPAGTVLPPNGLLVVHWNTTGTNTASDVYFPGKELAETSDLALYAANSIANGGFSNPANIRTFVQWGGVPAGGRQSVAATAGIWTSSTFIPLPAAGHSLELCSGTGITPSSYSDQANPTIGDNNSCHVAVQSVSWGQVKAIFQ